MIKSLIDRRVLAWLTSMGYTVEGKSGDEVEAMLRREARQWGLTMDELVQIIGEACRRDPDYTLQPN